LFILFMLVYVCNVKWFTMVVDHYWNFDFATWFFSCSCCNSKPPFLNKLIVCTLHYSINLFCFMCTLCVWLAKFEHLLAYDIYECIQNILLCNGVNNYCPLLCCFESILSPLKNEKHSKLATMFFPLKLNIQYLN
jgi:hypothetical protein